MEQLLSDDITFRNDESHKKMEEGLKVLLGLMSPPSLFDFMFKHLRFPNLAVKLVDYSNARGNDIKKLDAFRNAMGIPDAKGKNTILKTLQGEWDKIGKLTDENLEKFIGVITGLMSKAEFEARFTGDYTYLKRLAQYLERANKEKQARLDNLSPGDKIIKKPGDVATNVLEPPPKSI